MEIKRIDIEKAAKNAYILQKNIRFYIDNCFDFVEVEKEIKALLGEFIAIRDGLKYWETDSKNEVFLNTVKTAKIKELPACFNSLCEAVGDVEIRGNLKYKHCNLLKECERVCREIAQKLKSLTPAKPQQPTTQRPAMEHYSGNETPEQYKRLFEKLKENNFFDDTADSETWLYICGHGDYKTTYRPLNWVKSPAFLTYLLYYLFYSSLKIWAIAASCFTMGGNKLKARNLAKNYNDSNVSNNDELNKLKRLLDNWQNNIKTEKNK